MKTYRLNTSYTPFWTNEYKPFPNWHIEDKIETIGAWEELPNKVQWALPSEEAILRCHEANCPKYIKINDGRHNYYFYKNELIQTLGQKDGTFIYEYSFQLDKWMTYWYWMFKQLEIANPYVYFVRKLDTRFLVYENAQGQLRFKIDLLLQKYLANHLDEKQPQLVRRYLGGVNSDILHFNNFGTLPEGSFVFKDVNSANTTNILTSDLDRGNGKGLFDYCVCKSSALKNTTGLNVNQGDFLIIPLYNQDIYTGCLNPTETPTDNNILPFATGECVGAFSCDIPPSLLCRSQSSALWFVTNKVTGGGSYQIPFIRVGVNFKFDFVLFPFNEYQGFDTRFKQIFNNITKYRENYEPALLAYPYYSEINMIDSQQFCEIDASWFMYDIGLVEAEGLSINATLILNSKLNVIYNYGKYSNELNPNWNINKSNKVINQSRNIPMLTPASVDYFDTELSTIYFGKQQAQADYDNAKQNADLKEQNRQRNTYGGIFNAAGAFFGSLFGNTIAKEVSAQKEYHQEIRNAQYQQQSALRQIQAQITNISNAPSTSVQEPFLSNYLPLIDVNNDGKVLFQLYAKELHPWDKQSKFIEYALNGYYYNNQTFFIEWKSRRYMNPFQLNCEFNQDLIHLTCMNNNTPYNTKHYANEFCVKLQDGLRIYETLNMINLANEERADFVDNVEIVIHPLIAGKEFIGDYVEVTYLGQILNRKPETLLENIKLNNPNFPEDVTINDFTMIVISNHEIMFKINDDNKRYYGIIFFTVDPILNTWKIYKRSNNQLLFEGTFYEDFDITLNDDCDIYYEIYENNEYHIKNCVTITTKSWLYIYPSKKNRTNTIDVESLFKVNNCYRFRLNYIDGNSIITNYVGSSRTTFAIPTKIGLSNTFFYQSKVGVGSFIDTQLTNWTEDNKYE